MKGPPTATYADKITQAMSAYANVIKGSSNEGTALEIRQLKKMEELKKRCGAKFNARKCETVKFVSRNPQ